MWLCVKGKGPFPLNTLKTPYMANKIKERYFPTKYDESVEKGTFEVFNKPSMTEPDNAMSIPEIIARFTRGYGIDVQQHAWEAGSAFEGEDPDNFFDEFQEAPKETPQEAPKEALQEAPKEDLKSEGEV